MREYSFASFDAIHNWAFHMPVLVKWIARLCLHNGKVLIFEVSVLRGKVGLNALCADQ